MEGNNLNMVFLSGSGYMEIGSEGKQRFYWVGLVEDRDKDTERTGNVGPGEPMCIRSRERIPMLIG